MLNFSTNRALGAMLESFTEGVAVFGADHNLLYINSAMSAVTGDNQDDVGHSHEKIAKNTVHSIIRAFFLTPLILHSPRTSQYIERSRAKKLVISHTSMSTLRVNINGSPFPV